jgi:hypothetical protein
MSDKRRPGLEGQAEDQADDRYPKGLPENCRAAYRSGCVDGRHGHIGWYFCHGAAGYVSGR